MARSPSLRNREERVVASDAKFVEDVLPGLLAAVGPMYPT